MEGQRPPGQPLVLQRLAHHARGAHRQAVVGERGRARVGQLRHLGEPLTRLPHGDRGGESGRDPRLGASPLAQREQHGGRVHHRLRVGHGEDRAVATRRGGPRPGLDVLLVLASRRAQVNVGVHECREAMQALRVDQLGPIGQVDRAGLAQPGDAALVHQHVPGPIEARSEGRAGTRRARAPSRAAPRRARGQPPSRTPLMRAGAPSAQSPRRACARARPGRALRRATRRGPPSGPRPRTPPGS